MDDHPWCADFSSLITLKPLYFAHLKVLAFPLGYGGFPLRCWRKDSVTSEPQILLWNLNSGQSALIAIANRIRSFPSLIQRSNHSCRTVTKKIYLPCSSAKDQHRNDISTYLDRWGEATHIFENVKEQEASPGKRLMQRYSMYEEQEHRYECKRNALQKNEHISKALQKNECHVDCINACLRSRILFSADLCGLRTHDALRFAQCGTPQPYPGNVSLSPSLCPHM